MIQLQSKLQPALQVELRARLLDNRHLAVMLGLGLAYLVVSALCLSFDHRMLVGEYVWIKPCKFGLSIATYAASLLWLAGFVGIYKPLFDRFARYALLGAVIELTSLAVQSCGFIPVLHSGPVIDQLPALLLMIATKLGIMPVAMMMPVTLVFLCKQRNLPPVLGVSLRWAVFIATLGMIPGIIMVMPGDHHLSLMHHACSAMHSIAHHSAISPWLGWNTNGGDLRPAHFFGLHALQFMPIAALCIKRYLISWSAAAQTLLLNNVCLIYTAYFMLITSQALCGESIFYPSANTICLAITILVLGALGTLMILPLERQRERSAVRVV